MAKLVTGSSSPNSPGMFGALKDAIKATADFAAPKLRPRSDRTVTNINERAAMGELDERRKRQSSDHRN